MTTPLRPARVYKDLDVAFTPHPLTGDVSKKLDINSVRQSIQLLLFTNFSERLFQPGVGSPLYRLLFEPIHPITAQIIKRAIEMMLQNFEPRVRLQGVDVVPKDEQNGYQITIYFTAIGFPNPVTFSTTLTRLR